MMFASGLTLHLWGDTVQYAAYVLNRSPRSSNLNQASPLEILTEKKPSISDIVVIGSPCTVYRDPGREAWRLRAKIRFIAGKQDETKGFKGFFLTRSRS